MLTATYSLVAINAEQDRAHHTMTRLRQYLANVWHGLREIDMGFLEGTFSKFLQFEEYCRSRKLERYLIPALRRLGRETERVLGELDELSARGAGILRAAGSRLSGSFDGRAAVHEFCHSLEHYCEVVQTRLRREDEELIPLARRVLSIEEWFSVAAQLLSDDAGNYRIRNRPPAPWVAGPEARP